MLCSHFTTATAISYPVYKDECMYSFDTAEAPTGLDVCLTCFQAYSRAYVDYTKQHSIAAGHHLFLNIHKTRKPEPPLKLTKLEIKAVRDDELYDTTLAVFCSEDNATYALQDCPEDYQRLCEQVIKASSYEREEEVKAWEQEINPCEHSVEIDITPVGTTTDSHCAHCDLEQNLWICLHCGSLGCGRQQFGSTIPGNSHALSHYDTTGHSVAVKLGSLDKSSYDAYCYKCNDEVKVPNIKSYLEMYGINIDETTKTEQNLTEINLDQNLAWQFSLETENGEKFPPVYGENLTGLINLGNSCYLSSVVQSLYHLPAYLDYFKHQKFASYEEVPNPAIDLRSQMIKLYDGLVSGRYSKPDVAIKPTMFKTIVGKDHIEFKTNKQQDAMEFFVYLLDQVDKQLGIEINHPFRFKLTTKVLCTGCERGTARNEIIDNLTVQLQPDFIESFKDYCQDEMIEGYKCEFCKETTTAIKTCGFSTFPEILAVAVNRIILNNWVPEKKDTAIQLPEKLDITNFSVDVGPEYEFVNDSDKKFIPDESIVNNLVQMGFPETRCIKALYNTGNKSLDDAMNWIFAHMEDPDIDESLKEEELIDNKQQEQSTSINEEQLSMIESMGFTRKQSIKALTLNPDANAAVEWLFSNPDDDGTIIKSTVQKSTKPAEPTSKSGLYNLKAVICHKGSTPHTGHYVVFIKHDEKWILFNDEKVVECMDISDIDKTGYVYIFESQDNELTNK